VCSKSWPTFYVGQQCLPFANLFVFCWPTCGKRCAVIGSLVNMVVSEWTTLIILPHFTFALSMTAPKQISGSYVFAYEQLKKSLLQQRRRRLLSRPSPPYCCPTFVGQHLFVVCPRLKSNRHLVGWDSSRDKTTPRTYFSTVGIHTATHKHEKYCEHWLQPASECDGGSCT